MRAYVSGGLAILAAFLLLVGALLIFGVLASVAAFAFEAYVDGAHGMEQLPATLMAAAVGIVTAAAVGFVTVGLAVGINRAAIRVRMPSDLN